MEYRMTHMHKRPPNAERTLDYEPVFITANNFDGAYSRYVSRFPEAARETVAAHVWSGTSDGYRYANGIRQLQGHKPGEPGRQRSAVFTKTDGAAWRRLDWERPSVDAAA